MIDPEVVEAFNSRPRVNPNNIKTMTASQRDQVRSWGSEAEALLSNRQLALFIHQYKFDLADQLTDIAAHTEEDNNRRIAIANQLKGIEGFVASLKRAVYYKNRVVSLQNPDPSE